MVLDDVIKAQQLLHSPEYPLLAQVSLQCFEAALQGLASG